MATVSVLSILLLWLPITAVTPNCCTLSTAELTATPSCSIGTTVFSSRRRLTQKCDSCPPGTCRVNDRCFCAADFAVSKSQQVLCEYTFGKSWPFSIGETDPAIRSCTSSFEGDETTHESCCALSEDELRGLVGWNDDCPRFNGDIFSSLKRLSRKCDPCPAGTCRLHNLCLCPLDFLNSDDEKEVCRASFTRPWPESVGLEDRHFRACVREKKVDREAFTFDNCCSLSGEQLMLRVGTTVECPLLQDSPFSSLQSVETCAACPFGSCRIGDECYCPDDFIEGTRLQDLCREDFGAVYPDSIGMMDKGCPDNPGPVTLIPSPPGKDSGSDRNDPPVGGRLPSRRPGESTANVSNSGSSGTTVTSSTSVSSSSSTSSASASASTSASTSASHEGGNHLSIAEIIGIVTGIISAVGVVVTWFVFCKRRKPADDPMPPEQAIDTLL